jgi:hypothetical protein
MACWVVPTIAAEIWGIPLEQVLLKIESGEVTTMDERGWTFVDIAPGAPPFDVRRKPEQRPPTYTVVSDDELAALADDDAPVEPPVTVPIVPEIEALADDNFDEAAHPDPDQEESRFKNWRNARGRTSRMRLAPPKFQTI